jgi:outer membrane protein TolC
MPAFTFRKFAIFLALLTTMAVTAPGIAQSQPEPLGLTDAIELALEANLGIKRSLAEIDAAKATKNKNFTNFLPTFNTSYSYLHRDQEQVQELTGVAPVDFVVSPEDEYTFVTSFKQPVFTGFALLNQYKIADLGLDAAEINNKLTRQDVLLDVKNAYFSVLKAQKLVDVAEQTVILIDSQKEVSENFYQVGMSPLNDLLQAQVQLANAKQRLITALNNLEIAKAQFNTVLRRPVNTPVTVSDITDYAPFDRDIETCLEDARENRLELQIADLEIDIAEREVRLVEKDFFPDVNLTGTYTRRGDDYHVDGGEGISDAAFWNIRATASWDFWQWGRTAYGKKEKLSRLAQAKYRKHELLDNIFLQVKQAFLRTQESEKNIVTIEKALEQAKENLRITREQYKEQVATQTDTLVAQTLLTETFTNYYNALYDFKIAKAILYRALGQEVME